MTLDLTTLTTVIEVKLAPLFQCPYCGRGVTAAREVAYPRSAVGAYAPVYRCLCRKFIGAPVEQEKVTDTEST